MSTWEANEVKAWSQVSQHAKAGSKYSVANEAWPENSEGWPLSVPSQELIFVSFQSFQPTANLICIATKCAQQNLNGTMKCEHFTPQKWTFKLFKRLHRGTVSKNKKYEDYLWPDSEQTIKDIARKCSLTRFFRKQPLLALWGLPYTTLSLHETSVTAC